MTQISLAKLLKLKARLAGLMARCNQEIVKYNTLPEGQAKPDIRMLIARYDALMLAMVLVKDLRHAANDKICNTLHRLEELKSKLKWLSGINTLSGPVVQPYSQGTVVYDATITHDELAQQVRKLETEIDGLQDSVDTYNATTKIDIPNDILELVRK